MYVVHELSCYVTFYLPIRVKQRVEDMLFLFLLSLNGLGDIDE